MTRKVGGAALLIAAIQYVIAEAVAASAWTNPRYSYSANYISDLGVPSCGGQLEGRTLCSPLHAVMNTGFVLQGVLFAVAALLLFRVLQGSTGWIYLVLAVVHGAGITLVGLVHGSPEALADGSMAWHGTGAAMAIVGGNLVAIVVGGHLLRSRTERGLGITGITLGVLGLASIAVLLTSQQVAVAGLFERGSVYSIIVAELVAGVALLSRRAPRAVPAERAPASTAG